MHSKKHLTENMRYPVRKMKDLHKLLQRLQLEKFTLSDQLLWVALLQDDKRDSRATSEWMISYGEALHIFHMGKLFEIIFETVWLTLTYVSNCANQDVFVINLRL